MQHKNDINRQGDSLIYEGKFAVYDSQSDTWTESSARDLYRQGIHRARTIRYNETFFPARTWEFGRQFVGAVLWRTLAVSKTIRQAQGRRLDFWGFKHPRTILTLPFIVSAPGSKMKFVHVIRDPKEVASGDNQRLFVTECSRYYGKGRCPRSFEMHYEFWTDVNWDVYQIARKYLSDDSYLMVRIEDLVRDQACVERLTRFVGLPMDRISCLMDRAMNSTMPHSTSFFGNQVPSNTQNLLIRALRAAPRRVHEFLSMTGYSASSFTLAKSCLKLPTIAGSL
jgi:hypothetical protein